MKYMDALIGALARRRPYDLLGVAFLLSFPLLLNHLTLLVLLHPWLPGFHLSRYAFMLMWLSGMVFVGWRRRAYARAEGMPAVSLWYVGAYYAVSILLLYAAGFWSKSLAETEQHRRAKPGAAIHL